MEITKADFSEWKDHPVTKEVFSMLQQQLEGIKTDLGNGITMANKNLTTDYLVGRIQGLNDFLGIDFEEPKEYGH